MELGQLHSLEVKAAGSANSTEPTYHIAWEDKYYNKDVQVPGSNAGSLTGATAVTAAAAPEADFVSRRITSLVVYNADDVSSTVTVQRDVNGTNYIIIKATLASGYSLVYDGKGFSVSPYEASASDSKATSNSVVISSNLSTGDSKAVSLSTIASGNTSRATSNSVIASTNLSTGDSKAASNSTLISGNTSRATSNSVIASANLSTGDSKAASLSTLTSTADSKGVSAATLDSVSLSTSDSKAVSLSTIASANLSTGDSKAASNSTILSNHESRLTSGGW